MVMFAYKRKRPVSQASVVFFSCARRVLRVFDPVMTNNVLSGRATASAATEPYLVTVCIQVTGKPDM